MTDEENESVFETIDSYQIDPPEPDSEEFEEFRKEIVKMMRDVRKNTHYNLPIDTGNLREELELGVPDIESLYENTPKIDERVEEKFEEELDDFFLECPGCEDFSNLEITGPDGMDYCSVECLNEVNNG